MKVLPITKNKLDFLTEDTRRCIFFDPSIYPIELLARGHNTDICMDIYCINNEKLGNKCPSVRECYIKFGIQCSCLKNEIVMERLLSIEKQDAE